MAHRWKFYRSGGVDQVQLRDGRDVAELKSLDEKLWVAVAMPVKGVHIDPKTLAALDIDGDGRVRQPEILQAVEWLDGRLKSLDELFEKAEGLPLSAIKDEVVLAEARRILSAQGKGDAQRIGPAEVEVAAKALAEGRFNGDGIVPADVTDDASVKQAIADVIAVQGSVPDRSGKPGIDRARLDAFFGEVRLLEAWRERADAAVRVLGDATDGAAASLAKVSAKLDDWFVRCRLAAYDARAAATLSGSDAELAAIAQLDLAGAPEALRKLPLARVEAGRALPLASGVNPAWSAELSAFGGECVRPILGARDALSEPDLAKIREKLAAHRAWSDAKPATAVEKLGLQRVRELASSGVEPKLAELIARDLELAAESAQLAAVEKLVLLRRDFVSVLHNYVNFSEFYGHRSGAFQAGTLVLDGRSCRLCLEVVDFARHASLAPMAGAFLAYLDCTRPGEKMIIAAAFTDGDADQLFVGRNGLFFDRKGRDWDATITKIISNPISVREAFWSPYKKLARLVDEQIGKRAAAADTEANAKLGQTAKAVAEADKPPEPVKPAGGSKVDVGTVAAIGVAVGGIGAMVTGIMSAFFGLGWWMPIGFFGVLLAISGPSMLLAFLKLRQRNLGPLLDANGWAINGRASINVPFGSALTAVARLPPGAERALKDPYAERGKPWSVYLLILILAALAALWYFGKIDRFLPERVRSSTVRAK